MSCYHPLQAWRTDDGKIIFGNSRAYNTAHCRELELPCGRCIGCRLAYSESMALRCVHEAKLHDYNSFVTLTYDDAHLPMYGDLVYRHFQLFMKRVRKRFGPVRFFMCGEYGDVNFRPHFHAILFGVYFSDRLVFKRSEGRPSIYTSAALSELWTFGLSSVGDVSFQSAAYCARYVCKKVVGKDSESRYQRIVPETGEVVAVMPEFARMSLKPGIGAGWFEKYWRQVYCSDGSRDFCVHDGRKIKPPKYYDKLLDRLPGTAIDNVEYSRYVTSAERAGDSTPERLAVRETVVKARLSLRKRSL